MLGAKTIILICAFLIIIMGGVILSFPVQEQENNSSEINERLDRIETGIKNSAIDVCFKLGGTWELDQNKNIVFDERIRVIDQNKGIFQRIKDYRCIKEGSLEMIT